MDKILFDNGYYQDGNYYFYVRDHLGNNRLVTDAAASVVQSNHYYPFGMSFAESTNQEKQPYKYNNKELDDRAGLNWYDYSARMKDDLGFTTMDPLAESDYNWSPYVYVDNNPMGYIDPTGMKKGDPDDPIQIPEVVIHPSEPQKGDQVLPAESPLWNLLYALIGSREYTPTYKSTETSNGFDLKYGTYLVGTNGKINGKKSNLITGEPILPTIGAPLSGLKLIKSIKGLKGARVFWSGGNKAKQAAETFAKANGQTTLEMTRAGQNLENLTSTIPWSEAAPMWQRISSGFANGVKSGSTVHVFQNAETGVSLNSVWRTIEYPILKSKGVNIIYHSIP